MSDLAEYLRSVDEERCNVEPWTVAKRCAEAAARVERLEAALRKIAAYEEGPVVTGRFDEPWSASLARAALEGK